VRAACEIFPVKNVMMSIGGDNLSPQLDGGAGPAGTLSYAIVLHDSSNNFTRPGANGNTCDAQDAQQVSFNNKSNNNPDPGYMLRGRSPD
jgi:hypothetical protein